jgi:2-dehydro-3-deoxyphosphogluconate aldolase / (4S)-4-hydroxy-2-oxoglutarate aldolase
VNNEFEQIFADAPLMAILRGMGVARSVRLAAHRVGSRYRRGRGVAADRGRRGGPARGGPAGGRPRQGRRRRDDHHGGADPGRQGRGARYLVSPGFNASLVWEARRHGLPILPGVATPSEVQAATALGLTWLKAFPAHWLGTEWFRHIRGPFPGLRFVATGGMDASNAAQFLDAGVRVVAVGSALEDLTQLGQLAER